MKRTRRSKKHTWNFSTAPVVLGDPRLPVIKHMEWQPLVMANHADKTRWNGVEPDAYTHAIWAKTPQFIAGIKDQCWYKEPSHSGWISLYIVNELEQPVYDAYIMNNDVWATWSIKMPAIRRIRIPRIDYDTNVKWGKNAGRTDDERFHDLGFYDKLLARGVNTDWLRRQVGTPRPLIIEQQPEEQDDEL